jgi:tRNA pseudouridine13 synthase
MKIKIKYQPEDFVVTEKATITLLEKGPYAVYLMTKRGWNTLDALREAAKFWGIPYANCAYGGRKDRWGLTTQWVTIKGGEPKDLELKDLTFNFKGYTDRQMGPDLIEGNHFKLGVRKLNPTDALAAVERAKSIARAGFINYFDDQRFGGYDSEQGFLAEKLLKNHLNGVIKSFIISTHPEDKTGEKERKAFFSVHWKDWRKCLEKAKTYFEKRAFARLMNDPKAFLDLIEDIPREELSMAVSAYQSFLWNETVRNLLTGRGWAGPSYPGVVGDYVFFDDLPARDYHYLKDLNISLAAAKTQMTDKIIGKVYEKVLASREINPAMFNKIKTRKVFFKPIPRKVIVKPVDLKVAFEDDEVYPGKKKLVLEFFLTKGSYATMFLKRIFAEERRSQGVLPSAIQVPSDSQE